MQGKAFDLPLSKLSQGMNRAQFHEAGWHTYLLSTVFWLSRSGLPAKMLCNVYQVLLFLIRILLSWKIYKAVPSAKQLYESCAGMYPYSCLIVERAPFHLPTLYQEARGTAS